MGFPLNRVQMTVSGAPGTGTITLGVATTGFQSFTAAGGVNGRRYSCIITDGNAWEASECTLGGGGTTLTRTLIASSTGSLLNLTSAAIVSVTPLASDVYRDYDLIATAATTSGTSVTFSSIPQDFSDLMLSFEGVSHSNGTNTTVALAASPDGTNFTGNVVCSGSVAGTATLFGELVIPAYRRRYPAFWSALANLTADNTGAAATNVSGSFRLASAGIQSLRVAMTAGSFDAGQIVLYGR